MRWILFLTLSLSAHARDTSCAPDLEANEQLIENLLREQGRTLGAQIIGLFETRMKNGETLLSKFYWSSDELGRPIEGKEVAEFKRGLKRSARQNIERINLWIFVPRTEGRMIQKIER